MQESMQCGDCPLAVLHVDSLSLKRTADYDEEGIELLSPRKRPRLEKSCKRGQPEASTKIADSPLPVKDEPRADKDACMDKRAENSEPMKLEDLILEQEFTEKEEELAKLAQKLKDQEKCNSQANTGVNIDDQVENKQENTNLQIVFSDEEDEGGANGNHVTGGRMLNSQMNRQIDRVQVFLKLERLKRPKK